MNAFRRHSYHKHDYEYDESQNGEEHADSHQDKEVKMEHGVEFDAGLIVKITLDEPIIDAKRFKVWYYFTKKKILLIFKKIISVKYDHKTEFLTSKRKMGVISHSCAVTIQARQNL